MVRLLGQAHGHGLHQLARAEDDRPVVADRETKSVSSEGTYDTDLTDRSLMEGLLTRQARAGRRPRCASTDCPGARSRIKVRLHDFTTLSRSSTLPEPHRRRRHHRPPRPRPAGRPRHLRRRTAARRGRVRAGRLDPGGPLRREPSPSRRGGRGADPAPPRPHLSPGMDVVHDEMGAGWVWGRAACARAHPGRRVHADDRAHARDRPRRRRRRRLAPGHAVTRGVRRADDPVGDVRRGGSGAR